MSDLKLKCRLPALVEGKAVKPGESVSVSRDEALILLSSSRFVRADSEEAKAIPSPAKAAPTKKQGN